MDSYKNAKDILPDELLEAVQRYLQGEVLYIPVKDRRRRWGERSGVRKELSERNQAIREAYRQGHSLDELATTHYLSVETLRKIVRNVRRKP